MDKDQVVKFAGVLHDVLQRMIDEAGKTPRKPGENKERFIQLVTKLLPVSEPKATQPPPAKSTVQP